jgi:hypothetical protein
MFFASLFKKPIDINIIIPGIYVSDLSSAESMTTLRNNKITHIISACSHIKPKYPKNFNYKVIEIDDSPEQNLK